MALKYGSKSGGFVPRSGQAKGMPFKEMGSSSPAKHDTGSQHMHAMGGSGSYRKDPDDENKLKQTGVGGDIDKDDYIKGNKFDTKENQKEVKVEETKPKKHKAQVRKQKRLNNITDRRNRKGKKGLTSRQIKLQSEVDKTAEQFVSDRNAKLQKAGDFAIQIGRQISGDSKGITTSLEDSTANRLNEAANAKKIALQKTVDNKEAVLPKDNKLATNGNSGEETANLEPATITSTDNSATRAVKKEQPWGTDINKYKQYL